MPMSEYLKNLVGQTGLLKVIEKAKGIPTKEYGMENSEEWNYFQQQVDDYRAGRSAYRGQRTTKGSPTFDLSDEEYKESSGKHYSGLLNQINANRPEGIGEFGLSTRVGRDDPSLINYNPNKTRGYTFSREGRMEEIDSDRLPDYPDVQQETTANRALAALDQGFGKLGTAGVLADSVLGEDLRQQIKSKIGSSAPTAIGSNAMNALLKKTIGPDFPGAIR